MIRIITLICLLLVLSKVEFTYAQSDSSCIKKVIAEFQNKNNSRYNGYISNCNKNEECIDSIYEMASFEINYTALKKCNCIVPEGDINTNIKMKIKNDDTLLVCKSNTTTGWNVEYNWTKCCKDTIKSNSDFLVTGLVTQ